MNEHISPHDPLASVNQHALRVVFQKLVDRAKQEVLKKYERERDLEEDSVLREEDLDPVLLERFYADVYRLIHNFTFQEFEDEIALLNERQETAPALEEGDVLYSLAA